MEDLSPCVFDVFVAPLLDAQSFTELALSARHTASCIHGSDNYETTRVLEYHRYNHPVNVLVRTDTTSAIRSALGVGEWTETLDTRALTVRLLFLENLTYLDLANTPVSDISFIATCVNLSRLNLSDTHVSDISPLATCVNLALLAIINTPVLYISPLATCMNLLCLRLDSTLVTNISSLSHLVARGLRIEFP